MRDDCSAALGMFVDMGKRSIHAGETGFVVFSAGRAGKKRVLTEIFWITCVQLIECQTIPFTAGEFDQIIKHMDGAGTGNSFGSLPGAEKRTGIYGFDGQMSEVLLEELRLLEAKSTQRQIYFLPKTHHFAVRIVGLGMTDQIHLLDSHR